MEPVSTSSPVANTATTYAELTTLQDEPVLQQPLPPRPLPPRPLPPRPLSPRPLLYVARFAYQKRTLEDLSIQKGELLYILDCSDKDWWVARSKDSGEEGYVPSRCIEVLAEDMKDYE
jgi:hypothetical protein